MTPTDYAKVHLQSAKMFSDRMSAAKTDAEYREAAGSAVQVLAYALEEMSTGMRATYILLDKMDKKLDQMSRTR